MTRGRARLADTPTPSKPSISPSGCALIAVSFLAFAAFLIVVFTVLLNFVLYDIFHVLSAPIDLWQGAAIYFLLVIIGGFLKK